VTGPGGVGRCAFTERFITGIMPTQVPPPSPRNGPGWELTSQWRIRSHSPPL
jgi:hypothetical protein